jgi:rod shape-determining protein MreD
MKVKIPIYAVSIGLVLILQTTLIEYITIWNIKPNLPIIFIISAAFLNGNTEGAVVGLATGLALDMTVGKLIGLNGLLGLYLGIVTGQVNKKFYRENLLVMAFLTFVCSLVYEFLVYFITGIETGNYHWLYALRFVILPVSVYNGLASLLVHSVNIRVFRRLNQTGRTWRKF